MRVQGRRTLPPGAKKGNPKAALTPSLILLSLLVLLVLTQPGGQHLDDL